MTKPNLSFEFFPPRSESQSRRFWHTLGCLETLSPSFLSVTYGALGSASQASLDTVQQLKKESSIDIAAHLTCAGQNRAELVRQLKQLKSNGVSHIVALRGDQAAEQQSSKYYHLRYANELVELITEVGGFDVSVAAYPEIHPEAQSLEHDLAVLKQKFELGASRALTQFFFEPEVFLRWRDAAVKAGIDKPLVPGILPIHDIERVVNFSQRCGANVPVALVERFKRATTPEQKQALGMEQCLGLCKALQQEGVDDFHFYTLNQSDLSYEVTSELVGEQRSVVAA